MYYKTSVIRTSLDKQKYAKLLAESAIIYEECEFSFGIYDGEELIAAISIDNNCIKQICIAVDYQGEGLASTLVSEVIKYASSKNIIDLFVFTKPMYENIFNSLGFSTIVVTEEVLFLENKRDGIKQYCEKLKSKAVNVEKVGALVMNLNPITNGHLFLIKKVASEVDHLHLFIVEEDKSSFPYEVRRELLESTVEGMDNITIHSGGDYIISSATFPTYFIKNTSEIDGVYPTLDAMIFSKFIAKALNIKFRYVGSEPYSVTTNKYNSILKKVLPQEGVEVIEVPRIEYKNEAISASTVRELLREGRLEVVQEYVPKPVFDYLSSDRAQSVIEKIKSKKQRH